MRLLNDATSPFGRKVMVAALEKSLDLTEEFVDLQKPDPLIAFNPLGQIPALIADDGTAIYDSMTILLYIDSRNGTAALIPDDRRWQVLTRAALCDGLMESVLQRVLELRRPDGERSPGFIEKLEARIARVLAELDRALADDPVHSGALRADEIAAACALEYVDFRYGRDWRKVHPEAAAWLAARCDRESLRSTVPTRTGPVRRDD